MNKAKIHAFFTLLLVLIMLTVSAVPSFFAKGVKVKLDIAGENGKVYVRLTAPEGSDISTMTSTLKFDAAKLTFNSVSYLTDDTIISRTDSGEAEAGKITANIVIADSITEKSKIFTYIFDIKDGAEGEIKFDFEKIEATDSANKAIAITLDGEKSVALTELPVPSPDVTQSEFKEPDKNTDNPKIPPTAGKIIAVSAIALAAVSVVAGGAVFVSKKRK